jgi:hypothetical protein
MPRMASTSLPKRFSSSSDLDEGPAVHVEADGAGEEVVVADGGLFLVVVGDLEADGAEALLDGDRVGVEGPVLAVEGAAQIVVLGVALDPLGADDGAGGIAHGDVEVAALDQRRRAAGGAIGAVGRRELRAHDPLAVGGVVEPVVGEGAGAAGELAHGDAAEAADVLEVALLVFDADQSVAEGLPGGGERLALELERGGVLEGALLPADGVEADGESFAELAVDVELEAVGAVVVIGGEELAEVFHQGALGEDGGLAAGLDVAEDERVRALAEVDALDVVGVARHVPAEVVAGGGGAAEAAEGDRAALVVVLEGRRGPGVGDEVGHFVGGVEAEILHEVGGDGVDVHRHVLEGLFGAGGGERLVGGPAGFALGRDDERREGDSLLGGGGSGGASCGRGLGAEGEGGGGEDGQQGQGQAGGEAGRVRFHGGFARIPDAAGGDAEDRRREQR